MAALPPAAACRLLAGCARPRDGCSWQLGRSCYPGALPRPAQGTKRAPLRAFYAASLSSAQLFVSLGMLDCDYLRFAAPVASSLGRPALGREQECLPLFRYDLLGLDAHPQPFFAPAGCSFHARITFTIL